MPVVPTIAQDYPDWHKGRSQFSLWYVEIHQPELLDYLEQLRCAFSDLLFTPNTRQFHITLFVCGFLNQQQIYNDDFSAAKLNQQLQQLQLFNIQPFQIKIGKMNSFESALFIEVEDSSQTLNLIRQQLKQSANEIAPLNYCPHITLGLYADHLNSDEVFERIQKIQQHSFEFDVKQLTFGTYVAQELQGPLSVYQQFNLGDL